VATHEHEQESNAPGKKALARRNILTALLLAAIVLGIYVVYFLLVYLR
jgi:hypothetical protein